MRYLFFYISGVAGAILEILAPGNFARKNIYPDYYAQLFWQRILKSFDAILTSNFHVVNYVIVCLYCFSVVIAGIRLSRIFHKGYFVEWAFLASVGIVYAISVSSSALTTICRLLFLCIFIGYLFIILIHDQKWGLFSLLVGVILSQGILLLSPVAPVRTMIPFAFSAGTVCLWNINDYFRTYSASDAGKLSIILVTTAAILNSYSITTGDSQNAEIHMENIAVLQGEGAQVYELHRLNNDLYSGEMPYQDGYGYIEDWIRVYYDISGDAKIIWK